jgi:hypothetical protein
MKFGDFFFSKNQLIWNKKDYNFPKKKKRRRKNEKCA